LSLTVATKFEYKDKSVKYTGWKYFLKRFSTKIAVYPGNGTINGGGYTPIGSHR